jgi:NADPH-dependent 2,4-dienoyl-CoA reductase/sulfur reductase-like enzyme
MDRLARSGIEVIGGEIAQIDPARRRVRVVENPYGDDPLSRRLGGATRDFEADHLIVTLGAELASETIPGLAEAGHNFYTLAGAESLRHALAGFTGGRIVVLTATPAYKCPAAPYEAAMLLLDHVAAAASVAAPRSTCMPPNRARWESPAPTCRHRCAGWSRTGESCITRNTR